MYYSFPGIDCMVPGKIVLVGMIFFLIISFVPSVISNDNSISVVVDDVYEYHNFVGHGLHGIRGGVVLDVASGELSEGLGYTHEEVISNIRLVFGSG